MPTCELIRAGAGDVCFHDPFLASSSSPLLTIHFSQLFGVPLFGALSHGSFLDSFQHCPPPILLVSCPMFVLVSVIPPIVPHLFP